MTAEPLDAADPAADRVLGGLDPEQRAAVLAPPGPLCILAGAGTGKTRTITHRIASRVHDGSAPAGTVLAVTFTARAAGELRSRLRDLGAGGVQARTFHAAALRQLSYFWPRVIGGAMPELVQDKFRLVAGAASRSGLRPAPAEVRDLVSEVEWARATLQTPATYAAAATAAGREPPFPPAEVAAVLGAYQELKERQGVVDFDDLLLLTAATLEEHREVGDEVRSRYRSFVVDEYQDVTPLQQRLLDAWLGGRDDLTVVGDAQQTIYSFTGASPEPLLRFRRRFPEATVVRLVRDYRSTPQVVALANAVLDRAPAGTATALARLELRAQRPTGPQPAFAEHDDEPAEAAAVVTAVQALLRRGVPAAEVAVLYRVNAQSAAYEAALASAGIPYLLRGGERFFERREVREAVLLLRGAARAADGDDEGLVPAALAALRASGWDPDRPPAGSGAVRERWESVKALASLAEQVAAARPGATLRDFVAELEDRAADQAAPTVDGVTLSTLHAAKGLEWDAVFLVGLVDGTLPLVHAGTDAQVEEERRLLYVGVTRAREHLTLSWSLARAAGGRKSRKPSRFLDGLLPPALARGAAARAASGRRTATCRVCEAVLDPAQRGLGRCAECAGDVDVALFERLRAWRADRARGLGQPAYCVFTDATLTALAEARPTSVPELVRVPGVGQTKLDRFGAEVLALVAGEDPPAPAD